MDEATREDEEISGIERSLEEGVVGGSGDEADGESALYKKQHFGGKRVDVGLVEPAIGREVDASDGQALRVEPREGVDEGQCDDGPREVGGRRGWGAAAWSPEQRGREVLGGHRRRRLARAAVDDDGVGGRGHAEVLERVLVRRGRQLGWGCEAQKGQQEQAKRQNGGEG